MYQISKNISSLSANLPFMRAKSEINPHALCNPIPATWREGAQVREVFTVWDQDCIWAEETKKVRGFKSGLKQLHCKVERKPGTEREAWKKHAHVTLQFVLLCNGWANCLPVDPAVNIGLQWLASAPTEMEPNAGRLRTCHQKTNNPKYTLC